MHRNTRRRKGPRISRRTLPGAPPGILVPQPGAPPSQVRVMAYGPDEFVEKYIDGVSEVPAFMEKYPVTWVDVDGVGDTAVIAELGKMLSFHKLALEDVVHVHQRAKVDPYGAQLFIVARMPTSHTICDTEQVSMFLGRNFVVTFQERPGGDVLDPVRLRIRSGASALRRVGADHLMYAVMDTLIDSYFPLIELSGDKLDALESEALERPGPGIAARIHDIKRDLLLIRRAVWPLRDAVNVLIRDESELIRPETRLFLRDCHDHTIQIIDLVETYRDMAGGLHDVYLSMVSQRTNEIMRVLTVISTIFMPLTFIVGVYGMNFDRESSPLAMPELYSYWGYPIVWLIMLAIAGGMLLFFRRKGWLGSGDRGELLPQPTAAPNVAKAAEEPRGGNGT